mmetsp:Transcript_59779/g.118445  ORF Transcript_59779/g.118445 Transcript_59779/m.118445 type:complete len:208 (+) Transcript_59779:53-676(+)
MMSPAVAAIWATLFTCITQVEAKSLLSRIEHNKSFLAVKSVASAEGDDNGADFPFRLPSAPPGHPAGPRRCATRLEFERHCYGFIYAVVGDPTKTDEHAFANEVGDLCGTNSSVPLSATTAGIAELQRCKAWTADLWTAAVSKLAARQRQAGQKITAVASGQGPRSYTEWCDKVYHAQKLPKKGSHRHATRVSTWGKKSGMAQEDLK